MTTNRSRSDRAAALTRWADDVDPTLLAARDTTALKRLAVLAEQQETIECNTGGSQVQAHTGADQRRDRKSVV